MNDERLREAYRVLLASRATASRDGCPSPEELRAIVERAGDETERLARLDHVMGCDACRAEFGLLRAAAVAAAPRPVAARRPLALAAALLLAVGLGFALRRDAGFRVVERGDGERPRLVSPMGDVRAADAGRLVWRAVPSALGYDVEVTTPSGEVRLTASTPDTTLALPAPMPGERLRWWVRARLPDGEQRSDVARITVLP